MRRKQYSLLAVTFGFQLLLYVLMVLCRFPTWAIWPMLLPSAGYAFALYGSPMWAKHSTILKMTVIIVTGLLLTFAAHIMLGGLFVLYSAVFRAGVPACGPE